MQIGESHMSKEEDGEYGSPHCTEDGGEEHKSSHGGDVVSEGGSADQRRHEEAEVGITGCGVSSCAALFVVG